MNLLRSTHGPYGKPIVVNSGHFHPLPYRFQVNNWHQNPEYIYIYEYIYPWLYPFAGGHNGVGWGGVGWGWWRSLHANTSLMLRRWWRSKYKRIQVLAAAALRRKPGIMSVLNALQLYRNDCSSGKICVASKDRICSRQLELVRLKWEKSFSALSKTAETHFRWQAWHFAHRRTGIITRIYIYFFYEYIYIYILIFDFWAKTKTIQNPLKKWWT